MDIVIIFGFPVILWELGSLKLQERVIPPLIFMDKVGHSIWHVIGDALNIIGTLVLGIACDYQYKYQNAVTFCIVSGGGPRTPGYTGAFYFFAGRVLSAANIDHGA